MTTSSRMRTVVGQAAALFAAAAAVAAIGGQAATSTAPVNTSPPTVSGNVREGYTLTASPGTWSGTPPITVAFGWNRCNAALSTCELVARGPLYVVQAADVGYRLRLDATGVNADGSQTAQASTGAVAAADRPVGVTPPTISGTPRVGRQLTADPGTWHGVQPITYTYQWLACDSQGVGCTELAGANAATYAIVDGDLGKTLEVQVTARNGNGTITSASQPSAVVAPRTTAPANTAAPVLAGEAREGRTLTVTVGSWNGTPPITFTLQWERCEPTGDACAPIAGATAASYTLTAGDVDHTLRVRVTASNVGGSTSAVTAPTPVVESAGPDGVVKLPQGGVSVPIESVTLPERLVVARVRFSPDPVRSRTRPLTIRVLVRDTRGYAVRGALVSVRSTPLVTTAAPEAATGTDGWVSFTVRPRASFPIKRGWSVQFFVRARKPGDSVLAGVSARRLVQVRTAP